MPDPKDRIDISEKVIIPLIGILVSLVTAFMAFSISEKQNQIQVDLKDIQTSQFGRELQQKYMEIFYTEIASGNAKRQEIVLSLLLEIEPEVGKKLNQWAKNSGALQEEAKAQSDLVESKINLLINQNLKNFEIGIYYDNNSPNASLYKQQAEEIRQELIDIGILESKLKIVNQWSGEISDYQIRYERDREDEVADALQKVLNEVYPQKQFRKQTIRGQSPDFISIFLGP
jgi:hypothetical protein